MSFKICGSMSNGDGLYDLSSYHIDKMRKLYEYPKAFVVMHMLIMWHVNEQHLMNKIMDELYVDVSSFRRLFKDRDFIIDENEFNKIMEFLSKNGLIKHEKMMDAELWKITIL